MATTQTARFPHAAVVRGNDFPPHYESHPQEWDYHGYPAVVAIDKANPDHWRTYVWQFVANDPDMRQGVTTADVWHQNFGYALGYYPVDTDDWEMIPDGPYCANCVRSDIEAMQPGDAPLAWHAELSDHPDEDSFGTYDRTCQGCGEVLYSASDA
jgi:hypothetical protein